MRTTLLVLAAGMGSRYGGLKQLDRFGPSNATIMDYSIQDAIKAGFTKVVFVIRPSFEEQFETQISAQYTNQLEVEHVFQDSEIKELPDSIQREKPWGTGHAILCAAEVIEEPFAVINADDFYGKKSFELANGFLQERVASDHYGMVAYILKNTLSPHGKVSRGVCEVDDQNKLVSVREHYGIYANDGKVSGFANDELVTLSPEALVSMNLWMFHPTIFGELRSQFLDFAQSRVNDPKAEFYIPSFVDQKLKNSDLTVEVIPTDEKWYGVTYKEDRKRVNAALKLLHDRGLYSF